MNPSEHWAGYKKPSDFENFRNNGGSAGLDGSSKVGAVSKNEGSVVYYQVVKDIIGDLIDLWPDPIGNPQGPKVDGRVITRSDIQNIYNAYRLKPYLEDGMTIVEIGPGFGGLSALIQKMFDVEYLLVDLPDQREIQSYYLGEMGFKANHVEPEDLEQADFVINIRSMMEMSQEQVDGYFDIIYELEPTYFYCVNRYFKWTVLKNYPFGDRWTPIISTPLLFEPYIHEFLLTPGKGIEREVQSLPPYEVTVGVEAYAYPPLRTQEFSLVERSCISLQK